MGNKWKGQAAWPARIPSIYNLFRKFPDTDYSCHQYAKHTDAQLPPCIIVVPDGMVLGK